MSRYLVWTPEYEGIQEYIDGWPLYGPARDVVEVEAENKRAAKIAGVRELRRIRSQWMQDQASNGASPFTGLLVDAEP